jgi:hypothetical protein
MDLVKVELRDGSSVLMPVIVGDPEEEVGLRVGALKVDEVLAQVTPFVENLREHLSGLAPAKTTVKFSVGVGWDSGVLTSVFGGPSADIGIEVELEWSHG